ncbi:Scr1 family TA system antitoxin-like transcriptional regulator [Nocardia niwae]|uniref:Scr1 family TA system antitoxin-like transcriptional regulator n=1 Tax=Nocardia niwae TaxID=626084 RepID=A0ABV2X6K3_9NOCA
MPNHCHLFVQQPHSSRVLVENITAELSITQPREIAVYHRTFDVLAGQSVTGEAARELIRKALDARTPRP